MTAGPVRRGKAGTALAAARGREEATRARRKAGAPGPDAHGTREAPAREGLRRGDD